jgi:hypothetical protein
MKTLARALFAVWIIGAAASEAVARVSSPSLKTIIREADVIVMVRVATITSGPSDLRVATTDVLEVWKGAPDSIVMYRASPEFACDMSTAVVGQTVVLFLGASDGSNTRTILHAGRGQMIIEELDGETLASLVGVVLPDALVKLDRLKPPMPARSSIPVNDLKIYVIERLKNAPKKAAQ